MHSKWSTLFTKFCQNSVSVLRRFLKWTLLLRGSVIFRLDNKKILNWTLLKKIHMRPISAKDAPPHTTRRLDYVTAPSAASSTRYHWTMTMLGRISGNYCACMDRKSKLYIFPCNHWTCTISRTSVGQKWVWTITDFLFFNENHWGKDFFRGKGFFSTPHVFQWLHFSVSKWKWCRNVSSPLKKSSLFLTHHSEFRNEHFALQKISCVSHQVLVGGPL